MAQQLNLVRAIDPRVDTGSYDRKVYSVFQGGQSITYQSVPPDGGVSNSQLNFTINPPSPYVFTNRRMMQQLTVDLTFTGVSAGAGIPLLQMAGARSSTAANVGTQFHDAPRAFPLQNALTNVALIINNDNITQNLNQYARALPRYNMTASDEDGNFSLTPSMLDQSQAYGDLDGFARDPLRGYGDNPLQCPRGGFVGIDVLQNDSTGIADTAIVRMTIQEYLFMSPLLFEDHDQSTGFYGVQDLQLQLSLGGRGNGVLAGLVASLWSHSDASASVINTALAQVVSANVLMSYITPDASQVIPDSNLYPYFEPRVYPTQTSVAVAPAALTTIQMNNVQLGSIPSRVFFFIDQRDQDNNISKTDCFFGIENIAISFDNRDNLLSNASPVDLYNIASKNRTNLSWRQWTRDCGAVLALDFGEDIVLQPDQAVGLRGTYNFRATIQCRNLSAGAVVPTLMCVVVSEGVMVISDGRCSRSVGILNKEDVLSDMPEETYRPSGSIYGGNFWSSLKNFGRKAVSFVKKYARPAINVARTAATALAPEFLPEIETVSKAAAAFGLGRGLVGGKKLTRGQLARMLE